MRVYPMGIRNISVDKLDTAIKEILDEYRDEIIKDVKKATRNAAKSMVEKTKQQRFKRDTGAFRNAIASKVAKETALELVMLWYVKPPHYRLTHLLEHGHALRNGGRSVAYNFVGAAVEQVENEFIKDIEGAVG